jgi:Tfp pilus assembly protein PilF
MLINNLAFALASDNRIEDALQVLRSTDHETVTGVSGITLAATFGLVSFRMGEADRGRQLYQRAMEKATRLGIHKYRLMADLYLAREEMLARTSGCRVAAEQALARASKSSEKDVAIVADQVRRLFEKKISEMTLDGAR